jgi:FKBP-type peptidyl-prolyl cis-trans isomerase
MNPMFRFLAASLLAAVPTLSLRAAAPQDPTPAPAPAPGAQGIPECKDMQKTASGLEYGFLKKGGDEAPPRAADQVRVHYTGWLTDGTKFDSSRDRGEPTEFYLNGVIAGWTEGLQLMAPGARCKFVIPAALAYGERGRPSIPPNSTLVFDVELLAVTKRMPVLRPAKPDAQKTTASGLKWEEVKAGSGNPIGAEDGVALRYAVWKPTGEMVDCTERQNQKIGGTLASLPFPFLKELAEQCRTGTIVRAEVPQALFPNVGTDTVWELEVTGIHKVPKFRELAKDKTVTTQSGLQYEVLTAGDGESPKASDTVLAHYTGWLPDGTLFDSSHARGEPTEFPLRGVIPGWTEGVQLMKPGAKFLFSIPGPLAYGERGAPPKIPANATLVFLIELVEIKNDLKKK